MHSLDIRAKLFVCLLASITSIAVSSFWGQLILVGGSLLYALCLKRPLILLAGYLAIMAMSLMALGFFWLMVWFFPRLGENFQLASLLVPFMRILVMLHAALPLILSSRIQNMLRALQRLHLPLFICLPIVVIFRFIPVFCQDIRQISESLKLRGFTPGPWEITRHPVISTRLMFTPLLFRALRSSEDLGIAAEMKGLGSCRKMIPYHQESWSWQDTGVVMMACAVAAGAVFCQLWFGGKVMMA